MAIQSTQQCVSDASDTGGEAVHRSRLIVSKGRFFIDSFPELTSFRFTNLNWLMKWKTVFCGFYARFHKQLFRHYTDFHIVPPSRVDHFTILMSIIFSFSHKQLIMDMVTFFVP